MAKDVKYSIKALKRNEDDDVMKERTIPSRAYNPLINKLSCMKCSSLIINQKREKK